MLNGFDSATVPFGSCSYAFGGVGVVTEVNGAEQAPTAGPDAKAVNAVIVPRPTFTVMPEVVNVGKFPLATPVTPGPTS